MTVIREDEVEPVVFRLASSALAEEFVRCLHERGQLQYLVEIHEGGAVIETADQIDLAIASYLLDEGVE